MTDWQSKVREAKRKAAWARKQVKKMKTERELRSERFRVEAQVRLQRTQAQLKRDIDPEKNLLVKRANGDVYMVNLAQGRVLDVNRGLVMTLDEGLVSEVNSGILEWESKRRIVRDSPTINMRIVQDALTGGPPTLPMPQIVVSGGEKEKETIDL